MPGRADEPRAPRSPQVKAGKKSAAEVKKEFLASFEGEHGNHYMSLRPGPSGDSSAWLLGVTTLAASTPLLLRWIAQLPPI